MEKYTMRLVPNNSGKSVTVGLYDEAIRFDMAQAYEYKVYADRQYTMELELSLQVNAINVYINGYKMESFFDESHQTLHFYQYKNQRIFIDQFGFVQICLEVFSDGNEMETLCSDYLNIMIRNNAEGNAIQSMAEYIYRHQEALLLDSHMPSLNMASLKNSDKQTLESQIALLNKIISEYRNSYHYFKNNAKFTLINEQKVDHFEKLRYVNANTVHYIVQHPEQLVEAEKRSGIAINGKNYLPLKVTVTDYEKTYDVYENSVVVNFLFTLIHQIDLLLNEAKEKLSQYGHDDDDDEYRASASYIYGITKKKLEDYLKELSTLQRDFISLYQMYRSLIPVKQEIIACAPKPTPTFLSLKYYHQLFLCIVEWFSFGVYDLSKEDFLMPFLANSQLYEYYVLLKLIRYFEHSGKKNDKSYKHNYHKGISTTYNNTFHFQSEDSEIVLYYQPVVNTEANRFDNGIALLRNNKLTPKERDYRGSYYLPDYIIKITKAHKTKYIVADAKYSTAENIMNYYYYDLAFKYLFSISSTDDSEVIGLCAISGKNSEGQSNIRSIYTDVFAPSLRPFADIVTIAPSSDESMDISEYHDAMLTEYFKDKL